MTITTTENTATNITTNTTTAITERSTITFTKETTQTTTGSVSTITETIDTSCMTLLKDTGKHSKRVWVDSTIAVLELTRGAYTVIDLDRLKYVLKLNWRMHTNGYPCSTKQDGCKTLTYYMHEMIIRERLDEGCTIDHISRCAIDNRKSNLRIADKAQQQLNKGLGKNNTTGYFGASKKGDKFQTQIKRNGNTYSQMHNTLIEAAEDYDTVAMMMYSGKPSQKFVVLNFKTEGWCSLEDDVKQVVII